MLKRAGLLCVGTVMATLLAVTDTTAATAPIAEARALSIEDVLDSRSVKYDYAPAPSPDGRWVAITVQDGRRTLEHHHEGATEGYMEGCAVLMIDTRSRAVRQISPAGAIGWGGSWSPDGRAFVFNSDAGGTQRLWQWNLSTDAVEPIEIPVEYAAGSVLHWFADSRKLLIRLSAARVSVNERVQARGLEILRTGAALDLDDAQADKDAQSARELRWSAATIAELDLHSKTTRPIVTTHVGGAAIDPRGQWLAYTEVLPRSSLNHQGAAYTRYHDVRVRSLATGAERVIARNVPVSSDGALSWSPDGRTLVLRVDGLESERGLILFHPDDAGANTAQWVRQPIGFSQLGAVPQWDPGSGAIYLAMGQDVWRIDAGDGAVHRIAHLDEWTIDEVIAVRTASKRSSELTIVSKAVHTATLDQAMLRISASSGHVKVALRAPRRYEGLAMASQTGALVYISQSADVAADLWEANATLTKSRPLTRLNPQFDRYVMGRERIVHWKDANGTERRGLLVLPAGYAAGTRVPLLIWMYESILSNAHVFGITRENPYHGQLYATRGYAFLMPDIEWRRGDVRRGIADQVLPAVDALAKEGFVDPHRVGVLGHSSGGYDVLALVTQAPWIKAAVLSSGVGTTELVSPYLARREGSSSADWVTKQMGLVVAPWEDPARYVANSAAFHLDKIQTPLLVLQGVRDEACTQQSDQLYTGLKILGKTMEYRRYLFENHAPDWWSRENQRDLMERTLEWFERYVKEADRG